MQLALYFGSLGDGHFLYRPEDSPRGTGTRIAMLPGFPWTMGHLDTGLLVNGKRADDPDGRVWWTCGGINVLWHAFYWWDRSGDSRRGSNSGFYVRGFAIDGCELAFGWACATWPRVVRRQLHPLILQPIAAPAHIA